MVNNTGTYQNSPYITVTTGTLSPGAYATVLIVHESFEPVYQLHAGHVLARAAIVSLIGARGPRR